MFLHDVLCHWFCIRAFFCTEIIPRNNFRRDCKFQNRGSLLVWLWFSDLKRYLSHFFALIMTFPPCFPRQTAGWTRIALVCSTAFEQQLSKMWIERGNTKRAFHLQSYNFKDSILLHFVLFMQFLNFEGQKRPLRPTDFQHGTDHRPNRICIKSVPPVPAKWDVLEK